MKKKAQSHLSLDDRYLILDLLLKNYSIRKIATALDKSPSSVSRELEKRRYYQEGSDANRCKFVLDCRKGSHCYLNCSSYVKDVCVRISKAPWTCNGCDNFRHCRKSKYRYDPQRAHQQYLSTLSSSREGNHASLESLNELNQLLTPLIKESGQSLYHAFSCNSESIGISISTIYRYIDKGYLDVRNIHLPRRVRYRSRSGTPKPPKETKHRENRTFLHFLAFVEKHSKASIYEMDTVIGHRDGEHKVVLTILLRQSNFMFAFLLPSKTASEVVKVFDYLEEKIGKAKLATMLYAGLTDNGGEFAYADALEQVEEPYKRTNLFYCDPYQSQQKGKIEKNHEYIRMFVPQGSSFDDFTQEDMDCMMNHINSVKRPQFDGKSPFEMLPRHLASTIKKLGYKQIPDNQVCLNMSLFKK